MNNEHKLIQSFQRLLTLPIRQLFWAMVEESQLMAMPLGDYRDRFNKWRRNLSPSSIVQPSISPNRPDATRLRAGSWSDQAQVHTLESWSAEIAIAGFPGCLRRRLL